MKKFLLPLTTFSHCLIASLSHSLLSLAQPTLNNSNFPLAGVAYNRFLCAGGSVGNAGANQQYDFSSNTLIWINDTIRYLSPSSTGFASFHPGASVATAQLGEISLLQFYSADTNAFWTSGGTLIGDFGKGMTAIHANHPAPYVDTLASNEYAYGHSETEISGIRFQDIWQNTDSILDYQTVSGKYIVCDGFGTLIAPLDTFQNVLRVKYIEFKFDSVFVNYTPVDAKTDTLYYYKYFAAGYRHPVLIANTNEFDELKWFEALVIPDTLFGCTDTNAENYNPLATAGDGTCIYCNQINYTVSADTAICAGDTVTLSASGATGYAWSTGASSASIVVSPYSSQTISVLLSNQSYCWEMATVALLVYEDVAATFWTTAIPGDSILFVNTSFNATDYLWDFGDSTTSNEKNPRHYYSSEGTFAVMLIASNPCSSDTFYMDVVIVGSREFRISDSEFQIYPNPNDGTFAIEILNNELRMSNFEVKIYNIMGEEIYRLPITDYQLPITDYRLPVILKQPNGIYNVQIQSGKKIEWKKMVICE